MTVSLEPKNSNDVEAFLAHYGVKGMRWGVRRKSTTSSDSKPSSGSRLNKSAFGRLAKKNAARYNKRQAQKRKDNAPNKDYDTNSRRKDALIWGQGFTKGVNKRMNRGQTYKEARGAERKKRIALVAGILATQGLINVAANGPALRYNAQVLMNDAVRTQRAKNGQKHVANLLADKRGLTSYKTVLSEVVDATSSRG